MLLALAAGCGDDDEASRPPEKPPDLTVPRSTQTERTDTGTAPRSSPSPAPQTDGSGGAPAPRSRPEDSPQNDTPPPRGSPAERFERFCDENPGACS
jgi:hypothetical protein